MLEKYFHRESKPEIKEVLIGEEGKRLAGIVFSPPIISEKSPGTLFVHGWRSKQKSNTELVRHLACEGRISFTFDLRGHGKSEGDLLNLSRKDYLKDVLMAYDFLAKRESVDPSDITVIGTSFGAYLSVLLSKRRSIKNLILRAPADYLDEGFGDPGLRGSDHEDVNVWRNRKHDWNASESLRALHEFQGRVLIVESENDEQVPHQTILNYVNAIPEKIKVEHRVLKGASHSISLDVSAKLKFQEDVTNWLKEHESD